MNKALFNKQYGLQSAVLEGRKKQTRRICKNQVNPSIAEAKWKVGEEVAVAQSYGDCGTWLFPVAEYGNEAGYTNMMFVKAELMPHRIKITNVRVERLQDISNEDCLKEGIMHGEFINTWDEYYFEHGCNYITAKTPCEAYKKLINRISGKGTWDSNPWVFVYDFELLR